MCVGIVTSMCNTYEYKYNVVILVAEVVEAVRCVDIFNIGVDIVLLWLLLHVYYIALLVLLLLWYYCWFFKYDCYICVVGGGGGGDSMIDIVSMI